MTKPKTLPEIIEGKRVQINEECGYYEGGEIFTVESGFAGECSDLAHWIVLDPISYNPPEHECEFVCKECNKIKK